MRDFGLNGFKTCGLGKMLFTRMSHRSARPPSDTLLLPPGGEAVVQVPAPNPDDIDRGLPDG